MGVGKHAVQGMAELVEESLHFAQREQGRVVVGYSEAQIYADSQAACRAYGLVPYDRSYDVCVQREYAARRPV